MNRKTDVVIIGTGAAGLYCALHFPKTTNILMITKEDADMSDSFLAQGGICMLRDDEDYDGYFEDTMRAGHYENNKASVEVMIKSSRQVIDELVGFGVDFETDGGDFVFTREGGHGRPRILFHKDITGKEITSTLLENVRERENITILEHTMMLDIICDKKSNCCQGIVICDPNGSLSVVEADYTVFACGGLGGLYRHSTNFKNITGDALAIAINHGIELEHIDYIQIPPTTLYSEKPGRRFLISESVRGEGAVLLGRDKKRFCDELLPRDVVTKEIHKQMEKDGMPYVWLSMENIPEDEIRSHFPNILLQCREEGYDPTKECIPVVPAQHYFMGGIKVNLSSRTSMDALYAIGETSCNGVHGKNRLASNSLLESMVFAGRAAGEITQLMEKDSGLLLNNDSFEDQGEGLESGTKIKSHETLSDDRINEILADKKYQDIDKLKNEYKQIILDEIEKEKMRHE